MWQEIKNRIAQFNKLAAAEVILLAGGKMHINAVECALVKGKVVKQADYLNLDSPDQLAKKISVSIPLILIINGKGIVTKKLAVGEVSSNPVSLVLPNSNPEEFYNQTCSGEAADFVSVARKPLLDEMVQLFNKQGFKTIDLVIGPTPVCKIISLLAPGNSPVIIETAGLLLGFNNKRSLNTIEQKPESEISNGAFDNSEYSLGDQYAKPATLLPFASAIAAFSAGVQHQPGVHSNLVIKHREEFTYSMYFKAVGSSLLIGLFVILLINFFIYSYYFNKNKESESVQLQSLEQIEQLKKNNSKLNEHQSFLINSGWIKPARHSYFADRIASLVPANAVLNSLLLAPLKTSDFTENNNMIFKRDTIQLTGECENPLDLNQFMNNLRNISEIKNVQMKSYLYKKERESGIFNIEIVTK